MRYAIVFLLLSLGKLIAQEAVLGTISVTKKEPPDSIYNFVDEMPRYPGGDAAMYKYVKNNIMNIADSIDPILTPRVVVEFVVNKFGNVTRPTILRGISKEKDKFILKIFEDMPPWEPAKRGGSFVSVKVVFPIRIEYR